jgi:hypothetical protein
VRVCFGPAVIRSAGVLSALIAADRRRAPRRPTITAEATSSRCGQILGLVRHRLEPSRPDRGSAHNHRRGRSDPNWDAATTFGGVAPIGREHKPNGQIHLARFTPRGAVAPSVASRLELTLLAAGPALNPHYSYCIVRDSRERRPTPTSVTMEVSRQTSKRPCCARGNQGSGQTAGLSPHQRRRRDCCHLTWPSGQSRSQGGARLGGRRGRRFVDGAVHPAL